MQVNDPPAVGNLEIPSTAVSANPVALDQPLTLTASVYNAGNGSLSNLEIEYYLSINNIISSGDYYLGNDFVTLAPGQSGTETLTVNPLSSVSGLTAGTYYVGILVPGENEYWVRNGTLQVSTSTGTPDIRIEPLTISLEGSSSGKNSRNVPMQLDRTVRLLHGIVYPESKTSLAQAVLDGQVSGRHMLMQFQRMPNPTERRVLESAGIQILSYVPNQTYWVSVKEQVSKTNIEHAAGGITWAWTPPPEYKMSRDLLFGNLSNVVDFETVEVQVLLFEDVSRQEALRLLSHLSADITSTTSKRLLTVRLNRHNVWDLAALDVVEWIDNVPGPDAIQNTTAAARVRADDLRSAPYSVDGQGIVVGVWDGGSVFPHNDFGNRLTVVNAVGVSEHATHVAGTIGGDGGGNASATGMAPGAQLRSYDWNNDEAEMRPATGDGIVISNHSYGSITGWHWDRDDAQWVDYGDGLFGQYTAATQEWDDIVFDTGLLVFKSAGNDRNDCGSVNQCDGPYDSIPHKGNAKNIVTVCATTDTDTMTTFSSWGPTDDGRIKPDLCANGSGLTSTEPNNTYGSKSGTSMASPSAAGTAALLWSHLTNTGQAPTASILKALMIHGARDLGRAGPDYEHGWGLIDARSSADLANSWLSSSLTNSGDSQTFTMTVPDGASALKATLVWTDPAGTPTAATALVNDLDLVLEAPNGTLSRPWTLDSANPGNLAMRGINRVDNVEQVVVDNPQSGTWTVHVDGFAIPSGPQPFVLVAEGLGGVSSFTIFNDGDADLIVSSILPATSADWLSMTPTNVTVPAGMSASVTVTANFQLAPLGQTTTRLVVNSNDADESPYPNGVFVNVHHSDSPDEGLLFSDGFESGDMSSWSVLGR